MMDPERTTPLFSIIVPCYNRASYLPALVEGVKEQAYPDWEIVLMDDGSTDDTAEVVRPLLQDSRVKYFYQPNAGVSTARNTAVARASGEYLFFLDSDDKLNPSTLQLLATAIGSSGADLLFCSCRMIKDGVQKIKAPSDLGKIFRHVKGLFLAGAFSVRRSCFVTVGGYSGQLKFSENFELGLRLCQLTQKAVTIDHVAADYFIETSTRVSNSMGNKLAANLYILEKHDALLRTDPSYFSIILSQTGYFYRALGQKSTARSYYWRSLKLNPFSKTNLYRFLISFF